MRGRTLNLSALNIVADILWTSSINLAANAIARSEHLLHGTLQLLGKRFESHCPGDLNNLIKRNRLAVLDVLLLLSVARWLLERLDDEGRGGWYNRDCSLTVLDGELHGNTKSFLQHQNRQKVTNF